MIKNTLIQNKFDFDVIVIGGGASGMLAAGRSAELGKKVLILEKNKTLGEKLKITGGGRCNITNAEYDNRILLKNYGSSEQFLYSAFTQFGVKETFAFFEKRGLPFIIEPGKRAFPKTEKATDVLKVLEKYLNEGKVTVKTNSVVSKILKNKNQINGIQVGNKTFTAHSYVLATGGTSHPETGSTGDGFKWLCDLGHTVKPPTATVVPLSVKDTWVKSLSGISVSSMKITFYVDNIVDDGKTNPLKPDEIKDYEELFHLRFHYPNIWQNYISDRIRAFAAFVPVDEENTVIYIRYYQNLVKIPLLKELFNFIGKVSSIVILRQDKRVVITQLPKKSSFAMDERLIIGDKPIIEYRKHRNELIESNRENTSSAI